jgi:hypothetical protein
VGGRQENDADGALGHTKPAAEQVHAQAAAARRDHLLVGPRGGAAARAARRLLLATALRTARAAARGLAGWERAWRRRRRATRAPRRRRSARMRRPGPVAGGGVSWIMGAAPSEDRRMVLSSARVTRRLYWKRRCVSPCWQRLLEGALRQRRSCSRQARARERETRRHADACVCDPARRHARGRTGDPGTPGADRSTRERVLGLRYLSKMTAYVGSLRDNPAL